MGILARTILVVAFASACAEPVDVDLSLIDAPQLLAVAATPAEAEPGAEVQLAALWVDGDGTRVDDPLAWSLCIARRRLAELGPVAASCLEDEPSAHVELGVAPTATATIPDDACRLFGPDPPPAEPGEPQGRPAEPDRTGGYYQPVVVAGEGEEPSVYGVRIDCGVAGATQAQSAELRTRHRNNVAPTGELLRVRGNDALPIDLSAPLVVAAGETIEVRVRWAACADEPTCGDGVCTLDEDAAACADDCPDEAAGCGGAEWYAYFDPAELEVTEAREAIGVAWYSTDGAWQTARTGRDADDTARTSDNVWTAPDAGTATLWVVLRDDRGGASWVTLVVDVT